MSKIIFWHLAGGGASSTPGPCMRLWPPLTRAPTTPQSTASPVSAVPPFQQSSSLPSLILLAPHIFIGSLSLSANATLLSSLSSREFACKFANLAVFSPHCLYLATEIFLNMHVENVQMLASASNGQGSRVNQLCLVQRVLKTTSSL